MIQLNGAGVALITPFNKTGEVDYPSLKRLLELVTNEGIDYLVVQGTTSEVPTLSGDEKRKILDFILDFNNGRLPIVLGMGGYDTAALVRTIRSTDLNGVDAILTVAPYYSKPQQGGLYAHYMAVADASPKPVVLYNVPGRTGVNIAASTTLKLAHDHRNIIAVKEASGNMAQIMEIIKNKPEGFSVISGDDLLTLPIMSLGAVGVISVAGNACPGLMASLIKECLKGDYRAAAKIHYRLTDFMTSIFMDGSPAGIKAALHAMGLCDNILRLPLVSVKDEVYNLISEKITALRAE
ncbi:MAG: 4-hydroxy-tetrahydrodipicolinate synthase [Bacteroidota bacterium]|nr:4-hydroxy-tetrahydrodipicolinate synthase [Bacteroidota bacterium]